jgi:hypothetical protein
MSALGQKRTFHSILPMVVAGRVSMTFDYAKANPGYLTFATGQHCRYRCAGDDQT